MALSDADFYAFSRATGTPVVEDPEAKARIAPQVAEWRRNQLKSPETKQSESSNLLNTLGLGAAVAGLGALGVAALGRRGGVRMGNVGRAAAQGVQEVDFEDLGNVYRAAGRTQPPPSRPAPSRPAPTPAAAPTPTPRPAGSRRGGVQLADLGQLTGTEPRGLLRGREPGGEITRTPRQAGIVPAEITEVAVSDITPTAAERQLPGTKDFIAGYFQKTGTPAGYLTETAIESTPIVAVEQVKPESLVTKQQNAQLFLNDQIANAIGSAEDQMTGRVKSQLQRNEDLDMSQVDLLEEMAEQSRIQGMEQDEPINQVAASLGDGLPADQAEGEHLTSAQRYLARAREEISSELGEEGVIATPSRVESELGRRFGSEASQYGPKQTARRQALELYAQTGDPQLLENIRPRTIQFGTLGEVPVSELKKPVIMEGTAQRAEEQYQKQINETKTWLGNVRVEVEPQIFKLNQIQDELLQQQNMLLYSLNKKPDANLARQFQVVTNQIKDNQSQLDYLTRRLEGAQNKAKESIENVSKTLPTTLAEWSGEGYVIKPIRSASPEMEYEGDPINAVEEISNQPAEFVQSQLQIVPGGLLSGGRAKLVPNIGLVDDEGEEIPMKAASRTSIRGAGSMETYAGDVLSAQDIYGIQRAAMGASPTSPEAAIPPSASPSAYRLPAGSLGKGKQNFNVVVAGGREYENYPELTQKLDRIISELNLPPGMNINIVSGGAKGADTLAEKYAQEKGYGLQVFPADWENLGLSAGMQRNRQMAEVGDVLVAFPGGTGTENMIQQMTQDFGKPAYRASNFINPTPEQREITKQSLAASELIRRGNIDSRQFSMPAVQGPSQSMRGVKMPYVQEVKTEPPQWKTTVNVGPREWVEVTDTRPQTYQLPLASNIVPSTAASARTRTSQADLAAQQLESYMSKLQRGRSTPLTSQVVIQPRLF